MMFFDKERGAFRVGQTDDQAWTESNMGSYSFATGSNTRAMELYSSAFGTGTIAKSVNGLAMGSYNTEFFSSSGFPSETDPVFMVGNGDSHDSRSDAFVVRRNGNTTLNGSLTIDADNVGGEDGYTLPAQDGEADQVMMTNGDGQVSWENLGTITEVDGSITNEIQDLQLSGNTLTITNNTSASNIDLSGYVNTNTQLTEAEVDAFVSDNGYLTIEIDGSVSNEIQDLQISGNSLSITNNTSASNIDLSGYVNTNTQLTEAEVDAFVANNGYLTTEVDGSISNELQTISRTDDEVTLSNSGGSFSITDDAADPENEIQDLQLSGNTLSITNNTSATNIDLSSYINTNTQLTEAEVDAMAGNNGYLTTEIDGSISNEIQTISRTDDEVTLSDSGGSFSITDDDADSENELQDLVLSGNDLSITNNPEATTIDLSPYLEGAFSTTANVTSNATGNLSTDDFVFGSTSLEDIGGAEDDHRMFFDKSKGAFRAGYDPSHYWEDANVGLRSFATGHLALASGAASAALNAGEATGTGSLAVNYSFANGGTSFSSGLGTVAEASHSTATGYRTTTLGEASLSAGANTRSFSFGEAAFGINNTIYNPTSVDDYEALDRIFVVGNGIDDDNRSDALVMLKNGNTTIHGEVTIDADNLAGTGEPYTLPGQDGDLGQVMVTDGSGAVSWEDPNISPFVLDEVNNVIHNRNPEDEDFVFGSTQLDDLPGFDDDSRMFFDKDLSAFRAGTTVSFPDRWNSTSVSNVGWASIAMGRDPIASGTQSIALGAFASATGAQAIAIGSGVNAVGAGSTAMGYASDANGYRAKAFGSNLRAPSRDEIVLGKHNTDYAVTLGGNEDYNTMDRLFTIGNGISGAVRSDALIILKNGNAEINGELTIDPANDDTGYTLPVADGTSGQALITDGTGTLGWGAPPAESAVFTNLGNVIAPTLGDLASDDFVVGSGQLDDDPGTSDDEVRMFFDKTNGAFRAGLTTGTQWDTRGLYSTALGRNNQALGIYATAIGNSVVASGSNTFAGGYEAEAIGNLGFAFGQLAQATGTHSVALGNQVIASGVSSSAFGFRANAESFASFALGRYNIGGGNVNSWTNSDPIFEIGNGSGNMSRSNALTILKNGNTTLNGTLTIDGDNEGGDPEYTLPAQDGANGQVMTTNGAGNVAWASVGGGFTRRLGQTMNGGIVFYLYIGTDGLEHGLIVHPEEASHPWSTTNTVYGADRSWDGAYNTSQMNVLESPAKAYVESLGGGWYIPSIDELELLFNARFHANRTLHAEGYTVVSVASGSEGYWTSTESATSPQHAAIFANISSGNTAEKIFAWRVRAIRSF